MIIFLSVQTLSIPEATSDLAAVVARAIAGEEIGIRSGDEVVVLRLLAPPLTTMEKAEAAAPLEALRQLQLEAQLSSGRTRRYLEEVRAERLAAGERATAG